MIENVTRADRLVIWPENVRKEISDEVVAAVVVTVAVITVVKLVTWLENAHKETLVVVEEDTEMMMAVILLKRPAITAEILAISRVTALSRVLVVVRPEREITPEPVITVAEMVTCPESVLTGVEEEGTVVIAAEEAVVVAVVANATTVVARDTMPVIVMRHLDREETEVVTETATVVDSLDISEMTVLLTRFRSRLSLLYPTLTNIKI